MTELVPLAAALSALEGQAAVMAAPLAEDMRRPTGARGDLPVALARLTSIRDRIHGSLAGAVTRTGRLSRAEALALRDLKAIRARIRAFDRVHLAVTTIAAGRRWPLYPPPPSRHDLMAEQTDISDAVFGALHAIVNPEPQDAGADAFGCFPDIPLKPSVFLRHAHLAYRVALAQKRPLPLRFIDVGCGGGVKVMLAAQMFGLADGLEYDPGYAANAVRAVKALGMHRCAIFTGEALTFDGYGGYDVIFFMRPMRDDDLLRRMEARIIGQARPGTILIAPYPAFHNRFQTHHCARIADAVYVAGITGREARRLAAETARMGPDILNPDMPVVDLGWVNPLWRAAAANGIIPHLTPPAAAAG